MKARLFTLITPLFVAGLLLAGLGGGTASAASPGWNGNIVFEGQLTSNSPWELWVGNGDGTGTAAPLEIDTLYDRDPAWSPDGAEIAFDRAGTLQGIWVMNADGSGQRRLTNTPDEAPTWSPDGTRIAFERGPADGEIYVMNADGSGQTDITSNPADDGSPAWSPDGQKIAFVRENAIFVMNADGSDQTNLTLDSRVCDASPDWSPDGTKIAYARLCRPGGGGNGQSVIMVMDADGSNQTILTSSGNARDRAPAWSPNGTRIAFTHCDVDPDHPPCVKGREFIWVMNADGSGARNVTFRFFSADGVDWQPVRLAKPAGIATHQSTMPPLTPRPAS